MALLKLAPGSAAGSHHSRSPRLDVCGVEILLDCHQPRRRPHRNLPHQDYASGLRLLIRRYCEGAFRIPRRPGAIRDAQGKLRKDRGDWAQRPCRRAGPGSSLGLWYRVATQSLKVFISGESGVQPNLKASAGIPCFTKFTWSERRSGSRPAACHTAPPRRSTGRRHVRRCPASTRHALHLNEAQREQRQVHIHVQVGNEFVLRDGRLRREVLRSQFAQFFTCKRNK